MGYRNLYTSDFFQLCGPDWLLWSSSNWMGQVLGHWSKQESSNFLVIVDLGWANQQDIVREAESVQSEVLSSKQST